MPLWTRSSISTADETRPCTCQAILRTRDRWALTSASGAGLGWRPYVASAAPVSMSAMQRLHSKKSVAARHRREVGLGDLASELPEGTGGPRTRIGLDAATLAQHGIAKMTILGNRAEQLERDVEEAADHGLEAQEKRTARFVVG